MYIRLILPDDSSFFINELSRENKLELVEGIDKAFNYGGTLEFKVSLKQYGLPKELSKDNNIRFISIDNKTLDSIEFDINGIEIDTETELYFNEIDFNKLMRCGITCSHWLYDKDSEWIPFPKPDDYKRVYKIRYYKRGLTDVISSYSNWGSRYDQHSWHPSFESQHTLMLNPIIQQIYLTKTDSCYNYTILKQLLNI